MGTMPEVTRVGEEDVTSPQKKKSVYGMTLNQHVQSHSRSCLSRPGLLLLSVATQFPYANELAPIHTLAEKSELLSANKCKRDQSRFAGPSPK